MTVHPRVAFFTDAFHEPNGVASLSREFSEFALRHNIPFACVYGGPKTQIERCGELLKIQLERGICSFKLDQDLYCDPLLTRYTGQVTQLLREFRADLVHITGPGDMGVLGAHIAHRQKIPLVASWHTNLHEYAARRVRNNLAFLPAGLLSSLSNGAERVSLAALMRFYHIPQATMAPSADLVKLLEERTHKPCSEMLHGVDLNRFNSNRRATGKAQFTIGYVGRLTAEKNVRLLAQIEAALLSAGLNDFQILMVGEGSERSWLERNLRHAVLPGVLRGDNLANAFASMDVFVFPSETDTFGLVILEAMASGVPVVVARGGGPQHQVEEGVSGYVADNANAFADAILRLKGDPDLRCRMSQAARNHATDYSWDRVFNNVYEIYASRPELART